MSPPAQSPTASWAASLSGALTAAWLSGDPLSWQQAVGGAMILAAGVGDVLTNRDGPARMPVPAPIVPKP